MKTTSFRNKILFLGYGAVARCTLPLFVKLIDVPLKNITIMDFEDKAKELRPFTSRGAKFVRHEITRVNLSATLEKYLSSGDLLIDLAWNIDCCELLQWCHDHNVRYLNTSVEQWEPTKGIYEKTPYEKSLYYRYMRIRALTKDWKDSPTAVLEHGANPGLISHFTKKALVDIALKLIKDKKVGASKAAKMKLFVAESRFAELSMELGVKVIHCSERDTQITDRPKQTDEFVGTWSIEGFREEGTAPAEMGWGTHERELPRLAYIPPVGPKNQIFIAEMGINTWVRSWIPNEEIIGMVVRHGEAFSISDHLTVWKNGKPAYRPTVHYAYMPCNETLSSLVELRARNYEMEPKIRIMSDEITGGYDILGALLMGHKYKSWWTGTILGIDEARRLAPHQNATTVQVAISIIAATTWMIKNPMEGVCFPDDLPHEYILGIAKPYLGELASVQSDWTPLKNRKTYFKENPASKPDVKEPWSFRNFRFVP
ncbi:Saccharopine dehydrogenase NADP binding domain protein [uncultured archaeon]|nr:Saccharopine dehydrogenase NADP binding domain protein [uncultured archaeon]